MKKWTRLFALLLALSLFCMTGMSAMATEIPTDNSNQTEDDKDNETKEDETPVDPDDKNDDSQDSNTEGEKVPYPSGVTGTEAIEEKPAYVYKIRIFSGKQGVFASKKTEEDNNVPDVSGGDPVVDTENGDSADLEGTEAAEDGTESGETAELSGTTMIEIELDPSQYAGDPQVILNYGELINSVQLKDGSKYYVMGIRESGRDNKTVGAITITGDRDYVVAYGVRGKMVNYTVEFVNQAGESLAPAQTYEGKVGDKPVVAYLYIDGYRPQAYNLTKTLVEDEEENVFRFVYSPATVPPGTVTGSDGEYITIIDNGTSFIDRGIIGNGDIVNQGTTVIGAGGAGGAGGDGAGGAGDGAAGEAIADEQVPLGEPQQLIDLDDEDVPLAGNGGLFGINGNASLLGIPLPVIGVIVLMIAAGLWFAFVYMKKKKKETES